ncbi:hypothetical protein [Peptoanaerobacter stomatis]|uniref:hypothetical protein n=1 Tax=Peptoanaerobacter stomatis TaxID=796937 RepID=UPI003FA142B4
MRNARRITCNDYVQNFYEQHDFDVANKVLHGDFEKVKRTSLSSFHLDFEEVYNLHFTRYGKREKRIKHKSQSRSFSRIEKSQTTVSTPAYIAPKIVQLEPATVPLKKIK